LTDPKPNFANASGTSYDRPPRLKKRALDEITVAAGAKIVDGAKLVEFISDGPPSTHF